MTVASYTKTGTKSTVTVKLDKKVFGNTVVNHELLKQAYVAYLANGRGNLAVTKTRGLVSGGGKKPWKQKGTGRARFGSSRNPIWRGGGVAFGPTGLENYSHKLGTETKRQAIRQALSLAAESNKLIVLEDLKFQDSKTATAMKFFNKVGVSKNALVVVENKTSDLVRSTNNLSNIKLVQATYINVFDVLNADHIIITNAALGAISSWIGEQK